MVRYEEGYDSKVFFPKKEIKEENPCKFCMGSIFSFSDHREEEGFTFCSQKCVDYWRKAMGSMETGWVKRVEH